MTRFSILDLAPITENGSASESFERTVDLARHADTWGYNRYWLAEHHSMPGIASAATSVLIGLVAQATSRIRVGSGGIMLPNHAPLVIAEQFGTLDALYPGRIDLGLGRAPGSDQKTARALRRNLNTDPDEFPRDVAELIAYFEGEGPVLAVPGQGQRVPLWILGSSLFGAQLAAMMGLPYAFASHFAPTHLMDAIEVYRTRFKPSRFLVAPYVMLGFNVFAADTDEQAHYLASSWQQSFINLRTGHPGRLPPPVAGYAESLPLQGQMLLEQSLSCSAIGSQQTVIRKVHEFIDQTGADELILTCNIHDYEAHRRSFELAAALIE